MFLINACSKQLPSKLLSCFTAFKVQRCSSLAFPRTTKMYSPFFLRNASNPISFRIVSFSSYKREHFLHESNLRSVDYFPIALKRSWIRGAMDASRLLQFSPHILNGFKNDQLLNCCQGFRTRLFLVDQILASLANGSLPQDDRECFYSDHYENFLSSFCELIGASISMSNEFCQVMFLFKRLLVDPRFKGKVAFWEALQEYSVLDHLVDVATLEFTPKEKNMAQDIMRALHPYNQKFPEQKVKELLQKAARNFRRANHELADECRKNNVDFPNDLRESIHAINDIEGQDLFGPDYLRKLEVTVAMRERALLIVS